MYENIACIYLRLCGIKILARNYTFSNFNNIDKKTPFRGGEIDIIAQDKHTIIFIEVRKRSQFSLQTPLQSINNRKARLIIRTANTFLHYNQLRHMSCRFDLIGFRSFCRFTWQKHIFSLDTIYS